MDHFEVIGKREISLRELMDMCVAVAEEGSKFMMTPLLRVYGVGMIGFWSVVNGLTGMDLEWRCKEQWQWRLVKVKEKRRIREMTCSLPGG